jgi:hypothetical protein
MEICAGLTYIKEMKMLVGSIKRPILEKNINALDTNTLSTELATKVMMIHITSIDGKTCVPFMYFSTAIATVEDMREKILSVITYFVYTYINLDL